MSALVVLVRDKETVSFSMAAETCLNHIAQIASMLGRDIQIHAYDEAGAKWRGRGACYPAEPK